MLIELLKDKKIFSQKLAKMIFNKTLIENIRKTKESTETEDSVKLRIALEVIANQQVQIQQLATIMSVYLQSKTYDRDAMEFVSKMPGHEKDVSDMLKNMFDLLHGTKKP